MQIKQISIYDSFQCTGAECPVSCCRGWRVPIDDATYLKYLDEKGIFGFILKLFIEKKEDFVAFRGNFRRCPFWGVDRLCSIQKKHGTAYMPLVCIQFPRQLYHLGFFCEETLYLACPEAARLFLKSVEADCPFDFEATTGDVSYDVNTTNDDEEFLNYLLKSRDELIQMLGMGIRFDDLAIQTYGRDAQNACLCNAQLPTPFAYMPGTDEHLAFDGRTMDKLFFNGFYHPNLKHLSPLLYKLCRKYIRRFAILNRTNPAAADKKLAALRTGLCQKLPGLDNLLNRYFEYYLQSGFLDIYEDYSFTKHLTFGVCKANMLWVFIALYAENRKSLTQSDLAKIISVYERRAPQIEDALKKL